MKDNFKLRMSHDLSKTYNISGLTYNDDNIEFVISTNFNEVYSLLELETWSSFYLNRNKYSDKLILHGVKHGNHFNITNITDNNGSGWLYMIEVIDVKCISTIDYNIELLKDFNIPEQGEFTIELSAYTLSELFSDQEWYWTKDGQTSWYTVTGHTNSPDILDNEVEIWIDSVTNESNTFRLYYEDLHQDSQVPYDGIIFNDK
jgi:hypothetical protein